MKLGVTILHRVKRMTLEKLCSNKIMKLKVAHSKNLSMETLFLAEKGDKQ